MTLLENYKTNHVRIADVLLELQLAGKIISKDTLYAWFNTDFSSCRDPHIYDYCKDYLQLRKLLRVEFKERIKL